LNCPINRISYIPRFVPEDSQFYETLLRQSLFALEDNVSSLKYAKRKVAMYDNIADNGVPMPSWLEALATILVETNIFERKPNHVLVNVYEPGQGIMAHTDGPEYMAKTATLSIGGPALIKFAPRLKSIDIGVKSSNEICQVFLGKGSLLIFENEAYRDHLHSIEETKSEITSEACINGRTGETIYRDFRISFTFRVKSQ
jgi:alkylated DNA repair protein alkB family protein 6